MNIKKYINNLSSKEIISLSKKMWSIKSSQIKQMKTEELIKLKEEIENLIFNIDKWCINYKYFQTYKSYLLYSDRNHKKITKNVLDKKQQKLTDIKKEWKENNIIIDVSKKRYFKKKLARINTIIKQNLK